MNNIPNRRIFYVDTPLGKLKIYAKHDNVPTCFDENDNPVFACKDFPEDYPGIYIDLIRPGEPDTSGELLCVVEYASNQDHLQTVVYDIGSDLPSHIYIHEEY